MKTVLICGISGQDGSYLAALVAQAFVVPEMCRAARDTGVAR